jgi:hypothetical protein
MAALRQFFDWHELVGFPHEADSSQLDAWENDFSAVT